MTERPIEPLLKTKFFTPPVRTGIVTRPRLVLRLNAGLRHHLTLVSAPPGFGKTTTLAEWVVQLQQPVAWLSLDEGDNDPCRFLIYLTAALETVLPEAGKVVRPAFQSSQPLQVENALVVLLNHIAAGTNSIVLVLDDYHLIKAKPVHEALTFLLDHLPPQLHLVIATRTDPPLPLARLRGRIQLTELRAADLRFTTDEAAIFLNKTMGLNLSGNDVTALEARTEGWIVGLQLAALSMQGREDVSGFIAAFTGSHHYILDFLAEEVLGRQPKAVQIFLRRTAILDRLCGSLCDALLGDKERDAQQSQTMLEYLERHNLFIVPLDDERHWYRYHHLFADLLRSQLGRLDPDQTPELHRRASLWYEQQGLITEAVPHTLQAGDWPRAADLVEQDSERLSSQGEMMTLKSWLSALPEELVRARPRLCLHQAWIHVITGRFSVVESYLQDVERQMPLSPLAVENQETRGRIAAIRAYGASFQGEASSAITFAREALQYLPEYNLPLRGMISHILGLTYLLTGDETEACPALAEAARLGQAAGNIHLAVSALSHLGGLQMLQGRLQQAAETYQAALQLAAGRDGQPLPVAAVAYFGLSEVHYEWGDLEAAMNYAQASVELANRWGNAEMLARAPLALARVRQAQDDTDGANAALAQAEQVARRHNVSPSAITRVEACRVWLWLAPSGGNLPAAARWAEARTGMPPVAGASPSVRELADIILARVLIAQARYSEALDLLLQLRAMATASGRQGRVVELLVLEAIARQAGDELKLAFATLAQALSLAEPEGYVRTFVDEGAPVAGLLGRMKGEDRRMKDYIRKLLIAFGKDANKTLQMKDEDFSHPPSFISSTSLRTGLPPLPDPLSKREVEVLHCIAAGLSNTEIAQQLVIAVSTVKRHINHIFAKLDVTTRTQALVKAKELGIL